MNEPLLPPGDDAARGSSPSRIGLSSAEAAARLERDGPNLLPQPERRAWLMIIFNILREPMLLLLLAAATIYLLLGDPGEAAALGASVLIVIAITAYQEQKTERALQALREMSSPRARVLRDGEPVMVAGRDVVIGDVILVAEGDRVPADARVFEESDLQVDESMLTGESVPVRCAVASAGEGQGLLHASTLVVRGRGSAEVMATGARTSVGLIGAQLGGIKSELTPLQREIRRIVALFAVIGVAECILLTGLYVATRGGWLDGLLAGITLAMSNIPEEFPVVLTVFLALGAWRMAQHKALVRRASAIEALGAITVLCTDKTGTLTENRMAVAELVPDGDRERFGGRRRACRAKPPGIRRAGKPAAFARPHGSGAASRSFALRGTAGCRWPRTATFASIHGRPSTLRLPTPGRGRDEPDCWSPARALRKRSRTCVDCRWSGAQPSCPKSTPWHAADCACLPPAPLIWK